jgi:hypothetical protein
MHLHVHPKPDDGLPLEFLRATAQNLPEEWNAEIEYPGILCFDAGGRRWATGFTGLHVTAQDDSGDTLPGDQILVDLETRAMLTVWQYIAALKATVDYERRDTAREAAENAFWAEIAKAYPEIKTGDFDPVQSGKFSDACEDAVCAWLHANAESVSR